MTEHIEKPVEKYSYITEDGDYKILKNIGIHLSTSIYEDHLG